MVTNRTLWAVLLVFAWLSPTAIAAGIHAHEVLAHDHHAHPHAPASGVHVHAEGHDHEVPSTVREMAPPVRNGVPAAVLSAVVSPGHREALLSPGRSVDPPASSAERPGPREGPPLPILYCTFLI